MKRFSRLIVLLATPVVFAVGAHFYGMPAHAADVPEKTAQQPIFEVEGRSIQVIDGDTILINGTVADLAGMDAPELGQQCLHDDKFHDCGMSSAMQLRKYFAMAPFAVECWSSEPEQTQKSDDLPTVECAIGVRDVAAAMINDGEALPITGYSHRYDRLAKGAKDANIGIHGTEMILPSDWREGVRLDGEAGICRYVTDGKGHYISKLDPRFDQADRSDAQTICSDEEARQQKLVYLPPAP